MLAVNARFALLAAFCSLATLTFSPLWGAGAAAIKTQTRSLDHGYCHSVTSDRPSAQYVLPLPLQSKAKQFKVRSHEWLHSNALALFADIVFSRLKRDENTPGVVCKFSKRGDYSNPTGVARRSVLIPDNHGSEYVVSHSRQRHQPKVRMLRGIEATPISRRAQDAIVGNVMLVSSDYGSDGTGKPIAALYAAPRSEDPEALILFASKTNQTQFQLVNTPASVESMSDLTPVMLEMGGPGETRTCATYNSRPPEDESDLQDKNMTMEPCADRATPETGNKSQIFMYNGTSHTLEPTWNSSAEGTNTTVVSSPVNQNSTTSSNATATSSAVQDASATLLANRDIPPNATRQNSTVTLVFTPLKAMVADVGTQQNLTTTGMTMTMTKTVTVFNVESTPASVSSSTSNAASNVTETSSALGVELVGTPMPSPDATGSVTTGSASSSTTTGSVDAAAVASRIAASASASSASESAALGSSTDSGSPGSTQAVQRRRAVSDSKVTWMFRAEER